MSEDLDGGTPEELYGVDAEMERALTWKSTKVPPPPPVNAQRFTEERPVYRSADTQAAENAARHMPEIDPAYLNTILNSTSLDDATKAWLVATAQYPLQDAQAAMRRAQLASPQALEEKATEEVFRLKARAEAERRVAGENYVGSEELSWDDLEGSNQTYMVQDLLPDDGVVFLLAKPNLGKTFAYVDMVCSMVYGLPWLGKATRPAKVTIVLGEGVNGFKSRLDAWCAAHSQDPARLREYLTFVRGANLMSDVSIERIREVTERHGSEVIIFDTWANVSGVPDGDKDAMNSLAMNRALSIKPGVSTFYVHHPRKAEEDTDHPIMRGSGALAGRADVVMTMYRDKAYAPKSGESQEWIALSTEDAHGGKNRGAGTETIRGLYLDEHDSSRILRQLSSESISRESRQVMKHLKGFRTAKEYATDAGVALATAHRHLTRAVEEGVARTMLDKTAANVATTFTLVDQSAPAVNWPNAIEVSEQAR